MKLVIAEKPSLAKNIASALSVTGRKDGYLEGNNLLISWAFGHLFSLKEVDDYLGEKKKWSEVPLPFLPDPMEFCLKKDRKTKEEDAGVKKQYDTLKKLMERPDVDEIVHCGDADREGQIIIDLILENAGTTKKVSRLWLPEQTEETIQAAMKILQDNSKYKNLHNEGLARTYIDWLMGINLTRYVSIQSNLLFPCGRVLIPIVKFIYDRDMAIQNFKEEKYFILESNTELAGDTILLSLKEPKYQLSEKTLAEEKAQKLNQLMAKVTNLESKEIKKTPPKLFSLSKLQGKLSKDHKIPFASSLPIIQKLYEGGYITYPRTNTEYLAENEKTKVESILKVLNEIQEIPLVMKDSKRIFDDSKIESHSAITPTIKIPKDLSGLDKVVYDTVLHRFLSNFMAEDSIISQTSLEISVDEEIFTLKGETILQEGYLQIEPQKIENKLPKLELHQEFPVNFVPAEKKTSPPKKVTEEELSNYLKNPFRKELKEGTEEENDDQEYKEILKGTEIGTEATRTGIIENAKSYQYISQDKQNFSVQDKGIAFINLLDGLKIDLYKEKTVELSVLQKEIYQGTKTIEEVLEVVKQELHTIVNQDTVDITKIVGNIKVDVGNTKDKEVIGNCPRCGKDVYENEKSFYCSGYKEGCKFSLWKEDKFFQARGKKITKSIAKKLLKSGKVEIKGLKSKAGKDYDAVFVMKDSGQYVNFEMEFANKKK